MEIALRACTAFTDIVITVFMVSLLVKYRDLEFKRYACMSSDGLHSPSPQDKDNVLQASDHVRQYWLLDSHRRHHRFQFGELRLHSALWKSAERRQVAAFPKGLQFLAMEFPLSSLYVNALLANLNARRFIRKEDVDFIPYQTDPNLQKNLVFRDHDGSSVAQNRTDEAQVRAVHHLHPERHIDM